MSDFGSIIKNLLEEKNMTQRELAEFVDVTEVTISRYISGKRQPKSYILAKISDIFGVSIEFLLGKTENRNIQQNTNKDLPDAYFEVSKKALEMGIPADVLDNFLEGIKNYKKND